MITIRVYINLYRWNGSRNEIYDLIQAIEDVVARQRYAATASASVQDVWGTSVAFVSNYPPSASNYCYANQLYYELHFRTRRQQ